VIEKTLAKRYAAALLKVTDAEGSTEEAEQSLLALKEAYLAQKDFRGLLAQPRIPRSVKKGILRRIFEGKAKPSFIDFLELLIDKNRQDLLPDIADTFDALSDASRGVVRIQVRSWRPLTDAQRAGLQTKLQRIAERKVILEEKVDPATKGGVLCYAGDRVIDGSVAYRLKSIGEKFSQLQKL
jgi:F-type H+-transporting ATPase subunit delta